MAKEFIVPNQIFTGPEALEASAPSLAKMGKKALIVTDEVMRKLGNCAKVEQVLSASGVAYTVYDGVNGEPTDRMVDKGLDIYQAEG